MGRQSRNHRKPAEYRGFAYTTITSSSHHDRQRHPKRGPNRRTRTENQSSPHRHRPPRTRQPHPCRKTAAYQGSPNTTKTCHRRASHATTRARGPNPKSQAETGASPYPNLSAPGPPTTAPPQNRRIPSICLLSYNLQPSNQLPQPARATDRTGEHEPKTSSVHAGTDRHTATNHDTTAKQRNTRGHRYHGNQPQPSRPPKTPETRTEPENTHRKPIQSTRASAVTRTAATPVPQTARLQRPMNTTKTSHWHINYPTAHNFRDY